MFWLAPGAPKRFYAMTTYAGVAWATVTIAIAPATGGSPAALQWLQLDTVMLSKVTAPTLGTECFEPGSFSLEGGAPAPAPDVVPVQGSGHTRRPATIAAFPRSPGPWLSDASTAVFLEGEASDASASVPVVPPPAPPAQPVTVSVTGTGTGLVTSSPAGLTCGPYEVTCTGWFAEGATVTLTATPDAGQVFVGWTGACTGTGPCVVAIVGPQVVGALFGAPVEFYHLDVLGSVRMITNSAGAVVTRRDYLAFGEETGALTGDPRRFTGKELDPETALQYFGARYYRSEVGRFTSVDPVMNDSTTTVDPQRWNRYSYAKANPLRYLDPHGLEVQVMDARAFEFILGTLDEELRKYVVLKNGFIDRDLLKKAKTKDPSFLALLDLVNDPRTLRVYTDQERSTARVPAPKRMAGPTSRGTAFSTTRQACSWAFSLSPSCDLIRSTHQQSALLVVTLK